jgi:hypothetical protein
MIDPLLNLLHALTATFFGGALFAMLVVQSLLSRALDDGERRHLARAWHAGARLVVAPLALAGFVLGLVLMFVRYSYHGFGKVFACAPVYVHIMLGFGLLALGFAQVWKAKARKTEQALVAGNAAEAKSQLNKAWAFAWVAALMVVFALGAGVLKAPSKVSASCAPPAAVR